MVSLPVPNQFVRILVSPDSEKDWLPETIIPRPLREFYLAKDCRSDPMTTLHLSGSQLFVPTAPASCRKIIISLDALIVSVMAFVRWR
jgi:hypothetical protein